MTAAQILLVEDDPTMRMLLAEGLQREGYLVTQAPSGEAALELLGQQVFDLVVTDIKMRRVNGVQVLQAAKQQPYQPAVVLLTGFGSLETSIAALRAGAHDYLLKPCDPPDLACVIAGALVRRKAVQRRANALQIIASGVAQLREEASAAAPTAPPLPPQDQPRYIQVGDLTIDTFRRAVIYNHETIHLTAIEYSLLCCLAEEQGRAVSCVEIVRRTHGYAANEAEAQLLLKTHVRNLRHKIPANYLGNVRGFGYMLLAPSAHEP